MAIYHCSVKIIGRSKSQSAVAAAAYRAGCKLKDNESMRVCDYTRKRGVVYSEISLCQDAPSEYINREILWNSVQDIEKVSNAQFAREVEVAIPRELNNRRTRVELVRQYVNGFVQQGMCADWSIHDKGDGNPHAHIMLTMRRIDTKGSWMQKEKKVYALDKNGERIPVIDPATGQQKIGDRGRKIWQRITVQPNDWNDRDNIEVWRKAWAETCNSYLNKGKHIDHRSYKHQGIEYIPTTHEGYRARKMERLGQTSERCEYNREVREANRKLAVLNEKEKNLDVEHAKSVEHCDTDYRKRLDKIEAEKERIESDRSTLKQASEDLKEDSVSDIVSVEWTAAEVDEIFVPDSEAEAEPLTAEPTIDDEYLYGFEPFDEFYDNLDDFGFDFDEEAWIEPEIEPELEFDSEPKSEPESEQEPKPFYSTWTNEQWVALHLVYNDFKNAESSINDWRYQYATYEGKRLTHLRDEVPPEPGWLAMTKTKKAYNKAHSDYMKEEARIRKEIDKLNNKLEKIKEYDITPIDFDEEILRGSSHDISRNLHSACERKSAELKGIIVEFEKVLRHDPWMVVQDREERTSVRKRMAELERKRTREAESKSKLSEIQNSENRSMER